MRQNLIGTGSAKHFVETKTYKNPASKCQNRKLKIS